MPLLVQRQHDVLDEADLDLGYGRLVLVADGGDRQVELALEVALAEELLAHLVRPLARYVPRPAWVGDVRAFEGYLKDEVTVLRVRHVQSVLVQVALQTTHGTFVQCELLF